MARLLLSTFGFLLILPSALGAQVKIVVSARRYKAGEEIRPKVQNTGTGAVTLCVEFGQTSPKESTPSPFWVQKESKGTWGTLINGPDVGSARAAVVVEAGDSKEFPFRLNDTGTSRLRLKYWHGANPNLDCGAPPKSPKHLTSPVFTIE